VASALAVLDVIADEKLCERAAALGRRLVRAC
jgi:4-aminobutyrate aminotransferase-like enzyme